MFHKQRQPNPDMKKAADAAGGGSTIPPSPPVQPAAEATAKSEASTQQAQPAIQETADPKLKECLQLIEKLKAEKQELQDKYMRLGADYANYQKRVPRQVADSVTYEKKTFLRSMLGSLDNFAHALNGAEAAEKSSAVAKSWIDGIRMVYQQFLEAMKSQGVERVASVGKPFDPSVHEALTFRSEADKPDGIVLEEYQPGYTFNGQALRPCKVIVNKLQSEPTPEETTDDADGAESAEK